MKTDRLKFTICPHLHAMSDMGFASEERKGQGYTYSRPHTNNAECYADKCTNRGRCLIARKEALDELET